jgi:hypothetical protein
LFCLGKGLSVALKPVPFGKTVAGLQGLGTEIESKHSGTF